MGLVASQARLLMSFARKSDIEYRCQVISNRRMRLAFETGEVAKAYADALSNTVPISVNLQSAPATPTYTTTYVPTQTTSTQSSVSIPLPPQVTSAINSYSSISLNDLNSLNLQPYYADSDRIVYGISSEAIASGIQDGSIYLKYVFAPDGVDPNTELTWNGNGITATVAQQVPTVQEYQIQELEPVQLSSQVDRLYTEDDAAATAIYEAQTAILQSEDKRLELELKNLETQHKCISTEIDAIQKVIDKNIEKSFKTLG